jgi:hypothetical protein
LDIKLGRHRRFLFFRSVLLFLVISARFSSTGRLRELLDLRASRLFGSPSRNVLSKSLAREGFVWLRNGTEGPLFGEGGRWIWSEDGWGGRSWGGRSNRRGWRGTGWTAELGEWLRGGDGAGGRRGFGTRGRGGSGRRNRGRSETTVIGKREGRWIGFVLVDRLFWVASDRVRCGREVVLKQIFHHDFLLRCSLRLDRLCPRWPSPFGWSIISQRRRPRERTGRRLLIHFFVVHHELWLVLLFLLIVLLG